MTNSERDGFGDICDNAQDLIRHFCDVVDTNMQISPKYLDRIEKFFEFTDNGNCERTYKAIISKLHKTT